MSNPITDLFDFSFKRMVTPSYIKVLYVLLLVGIALYCLVSIVTGFTAGFGYGLLALVIAVIVAFIGVIFARIYMEVIMVFFRIKDLLEQMVEAKGVTPPAMHTQESVTPPLPGTNPVV
ncbi:MAG: DUF4282 domain-containing protein [Proteobacteria bacterium]|nr:DUF4282 domain-containing protein [Pseudomonadota bacterium]MBU4604683.1 DUF4282 domain-containing protein [Pseudomonadota bacterium]MCG2766399.1 DUF4282 domain-containing protein [Desulfarculaceae bacterium]